MGAVGALLLALAPAKLDMALLFQALDATTRLSAFVMFILIGARVFALTFYGVNGNVWVEQLLLALPGGQYGFLIAVSSWSSCSPSSSTSSRLAFIVVPLLAPAAAKLGIDLIWFGVLLAVNMQTSFMHAALRLRAVLPAHARSVVPIVMVALVLAVPQLVTANLGGPARAVDSGSLVDDGYERTGGTPRLPAGHPEAALEAAIERAERLSGQSEVD
jgi:TRAP-type mannitol/chloroaromatic compound transport system permease large subunit